MGLYLPGDESDLWEKYTFRGNDGREYDASGNLWDKIKSRCRMFKCGKRYEVYVLQTIKIMETNGKFCRPRKDGLEIVFVDGGGRV